VLIEKVMGRAKIFISGAQNYILEYYTISNSVWGGIAVKMYTLSQNCYLISSQLSKLFLCEWEISYCSR